MDNNSLIPKLSAPGIFYALASITLVIIGLLYFDSILKPFLVAFLIWFVINQIKLSLGKIKIKGKSLPSFIRSTLAFVSIFFILYLIVELLIINIQGIAASMPEYLKNFDRSFTEIESLINNPNFTDQIQEYITQLNLSGMATSLVGSLSGFAATSAVVLVYVIFFLMEDASYRIKFEKLFPHKGDQYVKYMQNIRGISESIRYYISSMSMISLATGAISYLILLLMGVEYAFLWSFLIFVLNFIPYIGPLISSLFPAIFAVIISGDLWQFVYVFAAMEGVQIIIGNFIQPMIMGKGSNLSPITVIVALAFWGMLWGIVGMILAVPVTSVMVIIFSQIPSTRWLAVMLSEKGNLSELKTSTKK
jgi:predicted PurR-regulated permease PerM